MKKLFIALGIIFLALIVLAVIGIGIAAFKGSALDKESKAYVDTAVPAIISSWNAQELLSRTSPEFNQATRADDIERLLQSVRSLGRLQKYQGSQGESVTSRIVGKGTTISARYLVTADFEAGTAKIYVTLIKHGNVWQIAGFRVEPTYTRKAPNQALERTADRREDLLSMISVQKFEAQRSLVSGRSAWSR